MTKLPSLFFNINSYKDKEILTKDIAKRSNESYLKNETSNRIRNSFNRFNNSEKIVSLTKDEIERFINSVENNAVIKTMNTDYLVAGYLLYKSLNGREISRQNFGITNKYTNLLLNIVYEDDEKSYKTEQYEELLTYYLFVYNIYNIS